jgi:hypothetical protein
MTSVIKRRPGRPRVEERRWQYPATVTFRMPLDMADQLGALRQARGGTLGALLRYLVQQGLAQEGADLTR